MIRIFLGYYQLTIRKKIKLTKTLHGHLVVIQVIETLENIEKEDESIILDGGHSKILHSNMAVEKELKNRVEKVV